MAEILRRSLKEYHLDIPGTAYFDKEVDHLAEFYQKTPKRQYFVLVDETGEVLGGAGIGEFDPKNGVAELQKLYIDKPARGKHLSVKLLDQALKFAKTVGYKKVFLESHHVLKAALNLYKNYGFQQIAAPANEGVHSTMDRFFIIDLNPIKN